MLKGQLELFSKNYGVNEYANGTSFALELAFSNLFSITHGLVL
jgi:hypothetical protein